MTYLGEFGITEMDFNRADIVLYTVYMFGSRNRNNPRFLGKKPCQSYPCRSSFLFAGEFLHLSGKSDIMLKRDKADSEFLKRRQQFLLRFTVPHGVFILYGSYRTDCVGTPYC